MIAEFCFVCGRLGEKRGRSGKLDSHNKIVKHEEMNVWLRNVARY